MNTTKDQEPYEETVRQEYERFSYLTPMQRLQWLEEVMLLHYTLCQVDPSRQIITEYFRNMPLGKSSEEIGQELKQLLEKGRE